MHGRYDLPSFALIKAGPQIAGGPAVSWDDLAHLDLGDDDPASPDFPERYGAEIIGAMRQKPGEVPGGSKPIFGVGGLCTLTTVTQSGVSVRDLCRFPDEIGRAIAPVAADVRAVA